MLTLLAAVAYAGTPPVLNTKADVNGDGRPDKVVVISDGRKPLQAVQINIGGLLLSDTQVYKSVTASMIDLDPADKKHELLVQGVADDGSRWFTVFGFDGRRVIQMLKASTKSPEATVSEPGGGELVVSSPEGYFVRHTAYKLGINKLDAVAQPFVYVDADATANDAVQLFDQPNGGVIIETIPAGATAKIVLAEAAQPWWLVVGPDGLTGWVGKDAIPKVLVPASLGSSAPPPADPAPAAAPK